MSLYTETMPIKNANTVNHTKGRLSVDILGSVNKELSFSPMGCIGKDSTQVRINDV